MGNMFKLFLRPRVVDPRSKRMRSVEVDHLINKSDQLRIRPANQLRMAARSRWSLELSEEPSPSVPLNPSDDSLKSE